MQQAFADVTMGYGEKVALGFDRKVFEGFEIPFADVFDPVAPDTRPLNFELHPFGRPIAVAHVGGSVARELAKAGPEAMKGFAIDTLVKAFGADIRQRIVASATTGWTMDEHIGGAYSGAAPGKAEARKVFSEPVHDRIFLAGEHVHRHYMATVHGAYETGLDAAHKAAAALGFSVGQKTPCGCPPKLVDFPPQASYIGWNNDQTSTHGNLNRCRGIVMKVVGQGSVGAGTMGPRSQRPAQHRRPRSQPARS